LQRDTENDDRQEEKATTKATMITAKHTQRTRERFTEGNRMTPSVMQWVNLATRIFAPSRFAEKTARAEGPDENLFVFLQPSKRRETPVFL
jgi:hypothetical protein